MREKHRQRDSDSQCVCGARRRERRGIVQHKSAPPDARPPELHTADQHTEQQGGDEPKVCAVIRGADRSVGPGTCPSKGSNSWLASKARCASSSPEFELQQRIQ